MQARLLVDKAHMGCVMGRGGMVVAEMRKSTGASIKIMSDESLKGLPGCERVHIFGEPTAVRAALEAISSKLRTAQSRPAPQQACLSGRHNEALQLAAVQCILDELWSAPCRPSPYVLNNWHATPGKRQSCSSCDARDLSDRHCVDVQV